MERAVMVLIRRLGWCASPLVLLLIAMGAAADATAAQTPPPVRYNQLVPGFMPETFDDTGMAQGTGFATANPWGAYTAYLLATNAAGQRTWRIENYLPNPNGRTAQGSTMYLFEGNERALLVDTGQNTADVPGKNDLKTVVKYLLGHQNDGSVTSNPVDFVVANTHSHGDHTGKNSLMSDRTVYYPDLDWPPNGAPPNYVPIKEGGGASAHGSGQAVGEIALGGRTLVAVDIHGHTPGSTGYLDRDNRMIATGDAIGSGYVWAQFCPITQYAQSVHHLQQVLAPLDRVDVLPAHFYQVKQGARGKPPINGRPLDKQYVDDQVRTADGILNGTVVSEPYRVVGRNTVITGIGSAQVVYTPGNIYGDNAAATGPYAAAYHAIAIPGSSRQPTGADARYGAIDRIQSRFYLIRDHANNSLYLFVGATRALLVGAGTGTPGLAAFVARLAGTVPVEVAITGNEPGQVGGLGQFAGHVLYAPLGLDVTGMSDVRTIWTGDQIDLGKDESGRSIVFTVQALSGHSPAAVTLIDVNDRLLLGGDALGTQGPDGGLLLQEPLSPFAQAFAGWRAQTDGKYDAVYTAHNYEWFTSPTYINELEQGIAKGLSGGDAAYVPSQAVSGSRLLRSSGPADVVASIVVK